MGFLKQTGKKKKKDQKSYAGEPAAEPEELMSEGSGLEKTMFLSPEERMGSGRRGGKHSLQEDVEDSGYSRAKIVQGNPIIINGEDYLLRISETRMEAFLILYRRF